MKPGRLLAPEEIPEVEAKFRIINREYEATSRKYQEISAKLHVAHKAVAEERAVDAEVIGVVGHGGRGFERWRADLILEHQTSNTQHRTFNI